MPAVIVVALIVLVLLAVSRGGMNARGAVDLAVQLLILVLLVVLVVWVLRQTGVIA